VKRPNYSAAYLLVALWLIFWVLHGVFAYHLAFQEAIEHQQAFEYRQFWIEFAKDTFENNQSEMLQIIVAAWVFKHLLWTGSPESKDTE